MKIAGALAAAWFVVGFVVGCEGHAGHAPVAAPADERARVAAEADRLVAQSQVLDYRAPQANVREALQNQGVDRYAKACGLGDVRSCWRAAIVPVSGSGDTWTRVMTPVAEHCLAGDAMSCRAVDEVGRYDDRYTDAPGWCRRGLGVACYAVGWAIASGNLAGDADASYAAGCDHGHVDSCIALAVRAQKRDDRKETIAILQERARVAAVARCKAGSPIACLQFSSSALAPFDPVEGFEALALTSARDGCRRGLVGDCYLQSRVATDPAERDAALLEQCATQGQLCEPLVDLRGADTTGGRDAYEHGCQRADRSLCAILVKGYRAHRWPEPVPDRASALARWLCDDPQSDACRQLDP